MDGKWNGKTKMDLKNNLVKILLKYDEE